MFLLSPAQFTNYLGSKWIPKSCVCKSEPVMICLFVTNRCTLSCKWCLRQKEGEFTYRTTPDMDCSTARKILGYFPKSTHLSFCGFGEPLLVQDLFKMIAEFRKRPMRISIVTNGTLVPDRIDEILSAKLHRISISMNSLNPTDYKLTCGGNETMFKNVLKGIKLLSEKRKSARPYLHLSFVLTVDLISKAREMIQFAEDTGFDYLDLHNLIPHEKKIEYDGILTMGMEETVKDIVEWGKGKRKIRVRWPRLVQKDLETPRRICRNLWNWLGIDMEGNTAGCSKAMATKREYGNLFEEGSNVWNNEFRTRLRAAFLNKGFLYDCCKTCTEVQP